MRRIRIGFHGVPGAGKTVLQSMFYGFRNIDDGCIVFTDAPTIEYLRPRWDQIREQRTPAATAMGKPDRLLWNIKTNAGEWEIEALDFAGALIEPVDNDGIATRLSHDVLAFLAGCDGLFLLIDPTDPHPRQFDALSLLLDNLRARSPTENGGIRRPVGLLLTKFDKLGPIEADSKANQLRAMECLRGHPILKPIRDLLAYRQTGAWWFRVFPVSVFGTSCKEGQVPPASMLKPYNLHEPLRWLVAEVDAERERSHVVHRRRRVRNFLFSVVTTIVVLFASLLFIRHWDTKAWNRATAADVPTETNYEEVRNLYRAWLKVPFTDAVRRNRANAAITRLEGNWDGVQYDRVFRAANSPSSWAQFDDALVRAKTYGDADRGVKRMSAAVGGLQEWANNIKSGKVGWHVRLYSVNIPYGSDLRYNSDWFNATVSFVLTLNGITGNTRYSFVEHTTGSNNYDLGFFPIQWGSPLRVQARLTVYNTSGAFETGDFDFTPLLTNIDPDNPPKRTRGVALTGKANPTAILEWECYGLAPPALPPYGK